MKGMLTKGGVTKSPRKGSYQSGRYFNGRVCLTSLGTNRYEWDANKRFRRETHVKEVRKPREAYSHDSIKQL